MNTPANQIQAPRWDRFQGATRSSYDPFVAATALEDPLEGVGFGDYARSIMAGGAHLGSAVGWLATRMGADSIGETIETMSTEAVDFWNEGLSDAAKTELARQVIRKDPYTGEYEWGDPSFHTIGLMGAQSLLGTGAGMGAGAGITRMLQLFANPFGRKALEVAAVAGSQAAGKKLALVDTVLGATGFGAGEGFVGGIHTGKSVYDNVMSLDPETLMQNERYRQVYDSADGMPELERHQYAADTVAKEASTEAGWQAGLTTALLGAPMGAYFGRILGGAKLSSTLPRGIATGATGEAAQEFAQSGLEQYISNINLQPFDPSIDEFEDVLNAAVSGALAGGLLGGGFGAAGVGPAKQQLAREQQQEQSVKAEKIGGDLKDAAVAASNAGVSRTQLLNVVSQVTTGELEPGAGIIQIRKMMNDVRQGKTPEPVRPAAPKAEKPVAQPEQEVTATKPEQLSESEQPEPETTEEPRSLEQVKAASDSLASRPQGVEERSYAGETDVSTQYQLADLEDLTTSHTPEGVVRPEYPSELQPRDRSRAASRQQVLDMGENLKPELLTQGQSIASGAPMVSPDGIVESGNGRVMAIEHAYRNVPEKAEQYKQYLRDNAEQFGLTAEQIDQVERPVLVRRRQNAMETGDLINLTKQANAPEAAGFSPVEQANLDAEALTEADIDAFQPDATGNVLATSNDAFVRSFMGKMGAAERTRLLTVGGQPTKQAADRIRAAIFSKAYADDRMLALMAEDADPDARNIVNAMTTAAPAFARARQSGALGRLDIVTPLLQAVESVRESRARGLTMNEFLAQGDMLEEMDPLVRSLATFLDSNIRSSKRLGEAMRFMGESIERESQNQQNASLFGADREVSLADIVAATDRHMTKQYGQGAGIRFAQPAEPAEAFSRAGRPLDEILFSELVRVQETGEVVEIERNAGSMLKNLDRRIRAAEQLRVCVRA